VHLTSRPQLTVSPVGLSGSHVPWLAQAFAAGGQYHVPRSHQHVRPSVGANMSHVMPVLPPVAGAGGPVDSQLLAKIHRHRRGGTNDVALMLSQAITVMVVALEQLIVMMLMILALVWPQRAELLTYIATVT